MRHTGLAALGLSLSVLLMACGGGGGTTARTSFMTYVAWLGVSVGSDGGEFCWRTGEGPESIAVDSGGNVYVTDTCNHRIQKFTTVDGIGYAYDSQWGSLGSGNGQFWYPYRVYVDASDDVFVADLANQRIQKFTSSGTYITQLATPGSQIIGLAEDAAGNLYLLDGFNGVDNRILKFTTTDGIGYDYASEWGSTGSGNGQFHVDRNGNLAVDASDVLYVADFGNKRVVKFDASGTFLGNVDCNQVQAYLAVTIDPELPALYVLDVYNNSVHKYRPDGTFVDTWIGGGEGMGQVRYPSAFVVREGYLYILDFNVDLVTWSHSQILKFKLAR